jgi:AraC-like DNA-binding protein
MESSPTSPLPVSVFSTGDVDPGDRWAVWRESISVIFDTGPAPGAEDISLAASVQARHLGSLVVGDTQFTPQRYDRSTRKIRRDGLDHYLVQLYRDGGYVGAHESGDLDLRAGDICLLDLGQPVSTRTGASRTCSLVFPREMLETGLPRASCLHGAVLRRESVLGRLLADHLMALQRQLPDLTLADAPAVVDAVTGMVAACFRPTADALNRARSQMADATLATIKRYIEERLATPELSPDAIAAAFRLSRTTLYRLFEPLGGVAAYIQDRRLARACATLVHPASRSRPIYEIAFAWGFASEVHFSRVFRRAFGLPPSAFRAIGRTAPRGPLAEDGEEVLQAGDYAEWIARLAWPT